MSHAAPFVPSPSPSGTSTAGSNLPALLAASHFDGGRGYLNACSMGIPTRAVAQAMSADTAAWLAGEVTPTAYAGVVEEARRRFARLVSVAHTRVAIGSQTSVIASLFAAAVPRGAEVLCVDGDFSSMVYPFLVAAKDRGYSVRHVPLDALAAEIGPRTALVSFSLVQSLDGAMADSASIRSAAATHGALTLCDLTQAAGVAPVSAGLFDATITNAYKWMMCPRGVAFLTVSDRAADLLAPLHAGWYAGDDVMASFYGPTMNLARDARKFDVSPAFPAWAGANAALSFMERLDMSDVWRYDVALADEFCALVDIEPLGQAIVSVKDPDGRAFSALRERGIRATSPGGRLRVSFHVWNTPDDVSAAGDIIRDSGGLT